MPTPSVTIADAVSGEEICPLCFDRYSGADQCTCVVCSALSCPSCAEIIDADGRQRCFACRPARTSAPAARDADRPLSLPRPIVLPTAARDAAAPGLPALPFPLTSSPYGVRALKPKPPGSVFVGLPPVLQALSLSLRDAPPVSAVRLSRRARVHLARLARLVGFVSALAPRVERARAALAPRVERARAALAPRLSLARSALLLALEAAVRRAGKRLSALALRLPLASKNIRRSDPSRPVHL